MKNKTLSIFLALVAVVVVFIAIWQIGKIFNPDLDLDETALLRFVFVV